MASAKTNKEIQGWELKKPVIFILGRHDSAILDMGNREQVHGYVYGGYDPDLSEKGVKSAIDTVHPPVACWYSSHADRAIATALIFCHEFQHANTEDAFDPADYSEVPESVVDAYMENFDDAALYAAYIKTGAHITDQKRAVARLKELAQEADGEYGVYNIPFGIISHDEICRLIMAFLQNLEPEQFSNAICKIARGELVTITIIPNGYVSIGR